MLLPIADATVKSLEEAPSRRATGRGPFNVLEVDFASWKAWAALPGWAPITSSITPVGASRPPIPASEDQADWE